MNMKEIAIVTEKTLSQYRHSKFEAGNILPIISRSSRGGLDYITIETSTGLVGGYLECFFDIKTVPESDTKSERLESALKVLMGYMFENGKHGESVRKTIELEATSNIDTEAVVEQIAEHLSEFVTNHCDSPIERIVPSLVNRELEVEA